MVESNVLDLVSKAVSQGSIAELNQLRKRYNWMAIPVGYVTQPLGQQSETALQMGVRNGHYDVVEYLVGELKYQIYPEWQKSIDRVSSFTWTSLNFNKVVPALVIQSPEMEVIRDIANQIPMIKVIEYLIDPARDEVCQWLDFVLNSIMASSASRTDKIIAFELIGVAFLFKVKPRMFVWRGLQCWEQAMALRYSTIGHQLAIPIIPDPAASSLLVDRKKVITSPTSLQKFLCEWRFHYNLLEAQTQALAVSQRIVNQSGQQRMTGPHSFHLKYLLRYANECYSSSDENQLNLSLNIALVILQQTDQFHSTSSPNCIRIFVETLDLLLDCLKLKNKTSDELSFANLLVVVKFGLVILLNVMMLSPVVRATIDRWQFNVTEKIHRLILEHLGRCRNPAEIQQLKDCLSPYFRANNLKRFTSLLHLAIQGTDDIKRYPGQILPIIQLFLDAGADPTGIDTNGKTPLHLLSENHGWFLSDPESYEQVFQALLDAGCCLDQSIPAGQTFLSILNGQKSKYVSKFRFHHYLDPLVNVVLPLACFCAKVIRRNQISTEGKLPPRLQSFVGRHSAMEDYTISNSAI